MRTARPRREVALVEHQVQHREDFAETLGELLALGHAERDPRIDDLSFGTDEALRDGRLGNEERPRDLGRGEAGDRAQCQRDLRFARERGVAAGEDQIEAIVRECRPRAHRGLLKLRELLLVPGFAS